MARPEPADTHGAGPRLALTGGTGRVATLLRPFLDPAVTWLDRGSDLSRMAGCDAVICLAGVTKGDAAALADNTKVAIDALDAAQAAGVGHVLLMSSAAIYGRAEGLLTADRRATPAAPYGVAKAAMEAAAKDWADAHPTGPRVTILRLGNVAGADALLGNLSADRKPDLHVWPDGRSPRRSYIGPRSLAHVLNGLAGRDDLPPILNVGTRHPVEMADLLRAAQRAWTPVAAPPDAIAEVRLDTAPLNTRLPLPSGAETAEGMVAEWQEACA
ncbi:NAD-dependent epimerase/dehydratase family protein [Jannaschia sp. 2305UL9-9]|uniref:NAD-dependent epimerase/dehydratase family protein n=1 Tax=Jannaschia sp. 2305UL9-9 TaxID=3121638 RepID=UPI0035275B19